MKFLGLDFSELDKKNKIILGSGIFVTSVTLLATVISAFFPNKAPDPKKLDTRTKVVYMASKEFASLPEQEKINYIKKAGRSRGSYRQLSKPEREAVAKNTTAVRRKIRIKEMKEHATKFFKMSKDEQNKYLDEMNARRDRWAKARAERTAQRTQTAQTGSSSNRNTSTAASSNRSNRRSARQQSRLEGIDSTTRAQWTEIRRLARARREQQKK
jgi:hypothetical protein